MLIREGDNFLEMIAAPGNPQYDTGVSFEIKVQSFGFTGQGSMYVDDLSLKSFYEQLQKLENQRQGKVELSSMPLQVWLKICSIDSLGHMALFGRISRWEVVLRCEHILEFGFSFDPTLLPSIVKYFETVVSGRFNL
ncbi:hypothetical protein PI95_007640 [Hassallia byssoidea VB512170]|uniref:Uncharacterized protein n=1 Tax=Hassallia byssoidea VB512170 TaxID=1304833 RepID=A0A846H748_9CYAN|nr:hypothetical protein [Hassalia byssoidea]NEU72449.1 hypothetical protein [Hassalia byssoidea VB512170]